MNCVQVDCDGSVHDVVLEYDNASTFLGGPLQIVGAVNVLNAIAVGLQECDNLSKNAFAFPSERFEREIRGTVLIIATDDNACQIDLFVKDFLKCIQ